MKKLLVLISCAALLFGCSSGSDSSGGSSTGSTGVTYTGATTPAKITAANYDSLAGSAVKGSSGGQALAGGALTGGARIQALSLANTLLNVGGNAGVANVSVAAGALQTVNQTINGSDTGGSGTISVTGQVDSTTGFGTVTVAFNQFDDGSGTTINGSMTSVIAATGKSLTFNNVSIQDATGTFTMSGDIKVVETFAADGVTVVSDTVTMNFAAQDTTGKQVKLVNFSVTSTYDALGAVTSESYSGRFYDSGNGYLDITTTTPLVYSPAGATNPSSGGPIIATGANNTKVRITPISTTQVMVEADTTGDGNYDQSVTKAWSAL